MVPRAGFEPATNGEITAAFPFLCFEKEMELFSIIGYQKVRNTTS